MTNILQLDIRLDIDQSTIISVNLKYIGDLKQFYSTPVDSTTPYEALRKIDLPKNLHIQQDYHRFHPGEMSHGIYRTVMLFFQRPSVCTAIKFFFLQILTRCLTAKQRFRKAPPSLLVWNIRRNILDIRRTIHGWTSRWRSKELLL